MRLSFRVSDDISPDNHLSLYQLGAKVYGNKMRTFVILCTMGVQMSSAIVYIAFLRDFLQRLFCEAQINYVCSQPYLPILSAMIIILPLSLISNFHYFSSSSAIGILLQLMTFGILTIANLRSIEFTTKLWGPVMRINLEGMLFTLGNFIFAFEGLPVVFEIRKSMARPNHMPSLLLIVMSLVNLTYAIFPGLSFLAFENKTKSVILFNYSLNNVFFAVASFSCSGNNFNVSSAVLSNLRYY
eukprot:TRINITY_DN3491_c0_g1_i2.p1 TRINITY_DN3491_c0_g1~~TRINITY_DN3491_c0_g1_i2.p1  ORF type:complete len:242 (-),score=-1.73 TRINITY_DN3491_c0_g1_i2:371-1096(-)